MDHNYEQKYHQLEENHWWFRSRREMILAMVQKLQLKKETHILEVGCSTGPLLELLAQNGFSKITGIDMSANAIAGCKKRGLKEVFVMDGAKTNFRDAQFDLIIASDILEHIEDDGAALKEWYRILKKGGTMIIFVPAFSFLWSNHDVQNHHYRRYTRAVFLKSLKEANFDIQRQSYWNFFLFSPVFFMRMMQKFLKKNATKDHLYKLNPLINRLLEVLLSCENWFLRFGNFPMGISIFAVCRK